VPSKFLSLRASKRKIFTLYSWPRHARRRIKAAYRRFMRTYKWGKLCQLLGIASEKLFYILYLLTLYAYILYTSFHNIYISYIDNCNVCVYFIIPYFYFMYILFGYTILRYRGLAWLIIMGSKFDDWIYWHFFTITVTDDGSHIELLLNKLLVLSDECSMNNLSIIWVWVWVSCYDRRWVGQSV
jgi:hypothetical protein